MTSKSKARGGNVTQATFLFDREPNEKAAVVMLPSAKTRTARTPRTVVVEAVPQVVAAPEPLQARARRTMAKPDAQPEPTAPVTPVLEAAQTPRRAARRAKPESLPPTEPVPSKGASEVVVQSIAQEQPRKRRVSRQPVVDAPAPPAPVENVVTVSESVQASAQQPRKRRAPRAAVVEDVMPSADVQDAAKDVKPGVVIQAAVESADVQVPVEKPRRRRASTKDDAAVTRVEAAPTLEQVPDIAAEQAVADVAHVATKPRRTRRTAAPTDGNTVPSVEQTVETGIHVEAAEVAKQVADAASEIVVKPEKRKRVKATASDAPAPTVEQIAEASVNNSVAEIVEHIAKSPSEIAVKPEKRKRVKATRSAVEAQAATIAPAEPEEQPKPAQKRPRKARPAAEPKPDTAMLMPVRNGQREIPAGPMFLMSYDDSPKRTFHEKVEAAMQAYQTRFARRPNLVLVNANVAPEMVVDDVSIERRSTVPPNNFWAGMQQVVQAVVSE